MAKPNKIGQALLVLMTLGFIWTSAYIVFGQDVPQGGYRIMCFLDGKPFSSDVTYAVSTSNNGTWSWHSEVSGNLVITNLECAAVAIDADLVEESVSAVKERRENSPEGRRGRFGPGVTGRFVLLAKLRRSVSARYTPTGTSDGARSG